MRRRISLLLLAIATALPVVTPVSAAEPAPSPLATEASPEPSPAPADPSAAPTGAPEPSSQPDPSVEPSAEPVEEPTAPPSEEPTAPPSEEPAAPASGEPSASPSAEPGDPGRSSRRRDDSRGRPDVSGRFIVLFRGGTDTQATIERHGRRVGLRADRTFTRGVRGFAAELDPAQRRALAADPAVAAIVPDEVIQITAQTVPTGVSRIGARKSSVASINGVDQRVDADVAIVDTGIQPNHPDLNVAGGYNCSSTNRGLWRDVQGHGTHVAGTVGALDNSYGAVGVAPGVRLWAVKILNDDGYGLLSWYVCGLDWILAQRDPVDSSRPLFEAVNMSVAKDGLDDRDCGLTNNDALHQAICRVVASGVTVVAAAANESKNARTRVPAAYSEVITVSALADTDGRAGGLGGARCWSWGGYDKDDTYADFSNYGSVVDIMAPGKCIWSTKPGSTYGYSSGTSMAAPAVAGAVALYKASRPNATPAEVKEALQYLGNHDWDTSTDPDPYHEKLVDVSRIGPLGSFSLSAAAPDVLGEAGGTLRIPVTLERSSTFFERVALGVDGVPDGWTATLDRSSLMGWTAKSAYLTVVVPSGAAGGTHTLRIVGTNQGRTRTANVPVLVESDSPTASAPYVLARTNTTLGSRTVATVIRWQPATDPSSAIAGYQLQYRRNGGSWTGTTSTSASVRSVTRSLGFGSTYEFRVRARDAAGNWSAWVESGAYRPTVVDDRRSSISYRGTWYRYSSSSSVSGTLTWTNRTGAIARHTFTGRAVSVVAPRSRSRGYMRIYVDGTLVRTVSLYSRTLKHRQVVFSQTWGASATHTIEIRTYGTSGRSLVSLDAILVYR